MYQKNATGTTTTDQASNLASETVPRLKNVTLANGRLNLNKPLQYLPRRHATSKKQVILDIRQRTKNIPVTPLR